MDDQIKMLHATCIMVLIEMTKKCFGQFTPITNFINLDRNP